jgi:hypothetical protein
MKTFGEFIIDCYTYNEDLLEGRQRRKLRGMLINTPMTRMNRRERSAAAIAKKAGIRGTGKLSTHDFKHPTSYYGTEPKYSEYSDVDVGSTGQGHYITSVHSPRSYASRNLVSKLKTSPRSKYGYTARPSSESVSRVKEFRKQMIKSGGNQRGKVHEVDILNYNTDIVKGDTHKLIKRGKNFIQAIKEVPWHLKRAGAKRGDTIVGKPSAVMDNEDKKTGIEKRAKLYSKMFKNRATKKSEKTGLMVGAMH